MSGILDHVWGASPGADSVWAMVTGLPVSRAGNRILMALQAYIDDSYKNNGQFIWAGYIATAEAWAQFSKEWEELLPLTGLQKDGKPYFHMAEICLSGDRGKDCVRALYRIIEKHIFGQIWCQLSIADLKRAIARVNVFPNREIDWEEFGKPSYLCFYALLDLFYKTYPTIIEISGTTEKTDFFYDKWTQHKPELLNAWSEFVEHRPKVGQYIGEEPIGRSSLDFYPLQAADLWAWWVRKWYEEGTPEKIMERDFGFFKAKRDRKILTFHVTHTEDQILQILVKALKQHLPIGTMIFISDNPS